MHDPRDLPLFTSVFHPSDFSHASESAFAHALAVALVGPSHLTILHAGGDPGDWEDFPAVRATLAAWGLLGPDDSRDAVQEKLAVGVKKVLTQERDPLAAILGYLDDHPTDLLVLATRGVRGLARWFVPSMAESLARLTRLPTLLVPERTRGFVDPENGTVSLRRILVPVDHAPAAAPAITFVEHTGHVLGAVQATLLHAGDGEAPIVALPEHPRCKWDALKTSGGAVESILQAARELPADLIVMVTDGRDGFLDILRGTHTERVLQDTPAPILSLPEGWKHPFETGAVRKSIADLASSAKERGDQARTALFRSVAMTAHPDRTGDGGELMRRAIEARDAGDVEGLQSMTRRRTSPPPEPGE
jgi:nucleotide-binding universal stress UspA family protein